MIKKYLEHIHYLNDDFDYDPEEIINIVFLPSGEYLETKRRFFEDVQKFSNWSDRLQCYVIRDKDYNKVISSLDPQTEPMSVSAMLYQNSLKNKFKILENRVIIDGDVIIKHQNYETFPVKLYEIKGNFIINWCRLTSLKNFPKIVRDNFDCSHNKIRSLQRGPSNVGGYYNCSWNKLLNLKGSPSETDEFDASHNALVTLEGCPAYVKGDFYCSHNYLTSLKPSPITVKGVYDFRYNRVRNLDGISREVSVIRSNNNPLVSNI